MGRSACCLCQGTSTPWRRAVMHLHGGDAGAGRDARRRLHRQGGDARQLQLAFQAVIVPQHGIVPVDVPAPEQVHLLAAVDDLPVGEVGALLAVCARRSSGSRLSGSGRYAAARRAPAGAAAARYRPRSVSSRSGSWRCSMARRLTSSGRAAVQRQAVVHAPSLAVQVSACGRRAPGRSPAPATGCAAAAADGSRSQGESSDAQVAGLARSHLPSTRQRASGKVP